METYLSTPEITFYYKGNEYKERFNWMSFLFFTTQFCIMRKKIQTNLHFSIMDELGLVPNELPSVFDLMLHRESRIDHSIFCAIDKKICEATRVKKVWDWYIYFHQNSFIPSFYNTRRLGIVCYTFSIIRTTLTPVIWLLEPPLTDDWNPYNWNLNSFWTFASTKSFDNSNIH